MTYHTSDGRSVHQFALVSAAVHKQDRLRFEMEMRHVLGRVVTYLVYIGILQKRNLSARILELVPICKILVDDDKLTVIRSRKFGDVCVETCGYHCDMNRVSHIRIIIPDKSALGFVHDSGIVGNKVTYLSELFHRKTLLILACSDIDKKILGGLQVEIIQERRLESLLDGLFQTVFAGSCAAAHQCHSSW